MSVNAIACAVPSQRGPAREPRPWGARPTEESLTAEPALAWTTPAGRGPAGAPVVGDSVIVVLTTDGSLVVVSRVSGDRIWSDRLAGPGGGGPVVRDDRIYSATADGRVYGHDLPTGRTMWNRKTGSVVGPLALAGERLLVAMAEGQVWAIEAARGTVAWKHNVEHALRSGPTIIGDRALIVTDDSLYQLDVATGAAVTIAPARGFALYPPAVTGDLVILGSPDGAVAAFDARTLAPAWRTETGDMVAASPVVARDTVFAITSSGTLWSIPLAAPGGATSIALGVPVRSSPTPIADGILVASISGEILRVSPPFSDPRWKKRVDGPLDQSLVVDHGLLVFVDGRGRIQAWR